jgi:hypothetical protein
VRKLATADRVPQDQVSALEGVQQVPPPRGGDWQRPAARRLNAQVELQLPRCRAAASSASSSASSCAGPRLDVPRPPPRQVHELNRRRARLGLHRPDIRHQAALQAIVSAQVRLLRRENLQASAPPNQPGSNCGPTRVSACPRFSVVSRAAGRTQWMWQPTHATPAARNPTLPP